MTTRIVIDTNIIFSALLSPSGTISELIFTSKKQFTFYTCSYLEVEIENHWKKLCSLSGIKEKLLTEAKQLLFENITQITSKLISEDAITEARKLVSDIDPDDAEFIALAIHINGFLWTGDKKLYKGLKAKNFDKIVLTEELQRLRYMG